MVILIRITDDYKHRFSYLNFDKKIKMREYLFPLLSYAFKLFLKLRLLGISLALMKSELDLLLLI